MERKIIKSAQLDFEKMRSILIILKKLSNVKHYLGRCDHDIKKIPQVISVIS